ncbi:Asp23/Gls24 family envelope stress response protein [Geodermatophilus sp. FMUSA9-8]|uniref:Asp23/Gls24 family envelope stress response protein n=1 Tax=Geodermatophilus sp. FMUSA9-8 TaxID=3120155 RepID=UPI00300B0185
MSTTTSSTSGTTSSATAGTSAAPAVATRQSPAPTAGSALVAGSHGRTTIADTVVSKIAGMAAREVTGVHSRGGGVARAFGAIRERIPGSGGPNVAQGVSVEVGETQAAVDIDIVAEYGVSIADLAAGIRRNVITSLERMTGLEVVEVNISVNDVHLPSDEEAEQPSRVA